MARRLVGWQFAKPICSPAAHLPRPGLQADNEVIPTLAEVRAKEAAAAAAAEEAAEAARKDRKVYGGRQPSALQPRSSTSVSASQPWLVLYVCVLPEGV